MAVFSTDTFMCRVPRPIRLYNSVYDHDDIGIMIPAGAQFISKKQYNGTSGMFHVTEAITPTARESVSYWCPAQMLQLIPMTDDAVVQQSVQPHDGTSINETVRIKANRVTVYQNFDGDSTVPNGLAIGDKVVVDEAVSTTLNGYPQTRLHIVSVQGEDDTLTGKWLLQNGAVEMKTAVVQPKVEEPVVLRQAAVRRAPQARALEEIAPPPIDDPNHEWTWDEIATYLPEGKFPENLIGKIPTWEELKAQIPSDWTMPDLSGIKFPEIPVSSLVDWEDIAKYLPDGKFPETLAGKIPSWDELMNALPDDWVLPDWLKNPSNIKLPTIAIPPEILETIQLPIDEPVVDAILDKLQAGAITGAKWAEDAGGKVTSFIQNNTRIRFPWEHDSNVDSGEVGNMYSSENVRWYYETQHEAFVNNIQQASVMGWPVGRMLFVHGMPFQFTHITDRRNGSTSNHGASDAEGFIGPAYSSADMYGRSFAKEIACNMPICTIVPGKPKFLTNISDGLLSGGDRDSAADTIVNALANIGGAGDFNSAIRELQDLSGEYEYYSMDIDIQTYFEYVNSMCHTSARLMGIGKLDFYDTSADAEVNAERRASGSNTLENFDWATYNTATEQDIGIFAQVTGQGTGVSFAYDPTGGGVSDTISTQTTESSLGSKMNELAGKARELEFLLGYSGVDVEKLIDMTNFTEASAPSITDGETNNALSRLLGRVGSWIGNTVHGMNIKFPEIWADSQHQRSYEIEMHFISPYATKFCKWRYVLVPFFHAFALAAPRSDNNVSQYRSPFLIRAYSKGYFNVEMGMIESLNWKRFGDGTMISEDGIPLQIDVSLQFKDLYHVLTMTNMYRNTDGKSDFNMKNFFNNTGLMDMIGTLSGVNMNRITAKERMELFLDSTLDVAGDIPGNFMKQIANKVRNVTASLWGM